MDMVPSIPVNFSREFSHQNFDMIRPRPCQGRCDRSSVGMADDDARVLPAAADAEVIEDGQRVPEQLCESVSLGSI